MPEKYLAHCPLDCPDTCVFDVKVENNKIVKIAGNKEQGYTRGFVCSKAKKILERIYSQERLLSPLGRVQGRMVKISWEDAYTEIAEKLTLAKQKYGPLSVLYLSEGGSAGVLKVLEERFFNAFGGATFLEGSLCWGGSYWSSEVGFWGLSCPSLGRSC